MYTLYILINTDLIYNTILLAATGKIINKNWVINVLLWI